MFKSIEYKILSIYIYIIDYFVLKKFIYNNSNNLIILFKHIKLKKIVEYEIIECYAIDINL